MKQKSAIKPIAYLALSLLFTCASLSADPVLSPIELPISRYAMLRYFDVDTNVDYCSSSDWSVASGNFPPTTIVNEGGNRVGVTVDWQDGYNGYTVVDIATTVEYGAELEDNAVVPMESVMDFAIKAKFADVTHPLWVRIIDNQDEIFQFSLRSTWEENGSGWCQFFTRRPAIANWGVDEGDPGEGEVNAPYRILSIALVRPTGAYDGLTHTSFLQMYPMTKLTPEISNDPDVDDGVDGDNITFSLPEMPGEESGTVKRIGNLYTPGEDVVLYFTRPDEERWKISFQLMDFFNNTLSTTTSIFAAGPGVDTLSRSFGSSLPEGYYVVKCKVFKGANDDFFEQYDFRFAVLNAQTDTTAPAGVPYFGMCTHLNAGTTAWTVQLMQKYGVHMQRTGFRWVENTNSSGNYELTDDYKLGLNSGLNRDIKTQGIILYGNPSIETDPGFDGVTFENGNFPGIVTERDAFADYAFNLVDDLTNSTGPVVNYFEVWNEWTAGTGIETDDGDLPLNNETPATTDNTPDNYYQLLAAVHGELEGLSVNNAEIKLIGLGGENPGKHLAEITEMLGDGLLNYCDIISVHPYRQPLAPEASDDVRQNLYDEIMVISDLMESSSVPSGDDETIWFSEIGWPTWPGRAGVSETDQARYLVRTHVIMRSIEKVENITWYDFKDDGWGFETYVHETTSEITEGGYWSDQENNFGIVMHEKYNMAPKPAVVAYAILIRMLELTTPDLATKITHASLDDTTYAYRFNCAGSDKLVVAWTTENSVDVDVAHLGIAGKTIVRTDMMGGVGGSEEYDSGEMITLYREPIYIQYTD